MKKAPILFTAFIVLLLLVALPIAAPAQGIRIGLLLPLSGKLSDIGDVEAKSFLMAVETINKAGGIKGRRLSPILEDTGSDPGIARPALEKLIKRDKVLLVAGCCSSSVANISAAICQESKVPFLITSASADGLTENDSSYVFRLCTPSSEYGESLKGFLKRKAGIKSAAVIHEDTSYGRYESRRFFSLCRRENIYIAIKRSFKGDIAGLPRLFSEIEAKSPDLLYIISGSALAPAAAIRQIRTGGMSLKMLLGNRKGFAYSEFIKSIGLEGDHIFVQVPWMPSVPYTGAMKYYMNFKKRFFFEPDYHGVQAFSGILVIADALKRSDTLTTEAVRSAFCETDILTPLGPVSFVSYGRKSQQNRLPPLLCQWIDGNLEIVWPGSLATAKHLLGYP